MPRREHGPKTDTVAYVCVAYGKVCVHARRATLLAGLTQMLLLTCGRGMYLFDFCGCTDDVTYVRCGAVLETAEPEARASAATAHSTEQSATQLNKEIPIIKFNPKKFP